MESEASHSTASNTCAPLFKRRSRAPAHARLSKPADFVLDGEQVSSQLTPEECADQRDLEEPTPAQDLIMLHVLSRKPTGIDLERLNYGESKRKSKTTRNHASQSPQDKLEGQTRKGGLVSSENHDYPQQSEDE
jgi:hypothetical protein